MNTALDLDRRGLCELRTSLLEGRTLNLIEIALLRTFLNTDSQEEEDIFKRIKSRSKMGTLKDEPAIQDVINIIDHRLSNNKGVYQLKSKSPRTILYGNCLNAIIQGASGKDYIVEVISDVKDMITNENKIIAVEDSMKQQYPDFDINGLQCLMDTEDTDLIHRVIDAALSSDKYKSKTYYSSVQEFLDSIETDTGFVVKADDYTIVVYSRGDDMMIKTTTSTSKNFTNADPTVFDLLFR